MKNNLRLNHFFKSLLALIVFTQASVYAQPVKQWDKAFGGSIRDEQPIVIQAADGGYFTVGNSASGTGSDKSQNSQDHDYWVVKFSATGTKEWDKTFGGPSTEIATAAVQASDGSYLIGGYSFSGQGGEKSELSRGGVDYWVVKLNGAGQKQWDKTIGGNLNDLLNSVTLTADGGFLLAGESRSIKGGDVSEDNPGGWGSPYGWLVKLSADGNILWDKFIGGDGLSFVEETSDHGYILTGTKTGDYWVIKLNSSLNVVWDKTFGGSNRDYGISVHQTSDGGYIVGGSTYSDISGNKTESLRGYYDYWILKLNADGIQEWQKALGGGRREDFKSVKETSAGNFIVAGTSLSLTNGDKTQPSRGESDYWIVKLSKSGVKIWDMALGGSFYENCASLICTLDGGYLVSGDSESNISKDRTDASRGQTDYWFVKLAPDDIPSPFWLKYFKVFKESSGTAFEWQTVTENKTHHFEVEYSRNKELWQPVANVPAKTLSYVPSFYRQMGANQSPGIQYYRLKMTDASGVITYSKTDSVIYDMVVEPTTIRINAGGPEFTTATKKKFSADLYYSGIDRTSSVVSGDILNTTNDVLYRSARCSPSFSYNIPVANGKVDVILHFAETYFGAPGKKGGAGSRRFHVNMEGSRILTNYDIFVAAGGAMRPAAYTTSIEVTDGMLNIDFLTGAADLPRISAIEVLRANYAVKPVADAYVRDGSYNRINYGDVTMLDIKSNANDVSARRSTYLKFQLSAAMAISSAKLRIYGHNHENSSNISVHAYGVNNDSWTENGIVKANAPAASTASLGYVAVNNVYKYYEIDVTSYVKTQQQSGEEMVSLLLNDPNNRNTRLVFNSKENTANPPQLVIVPGTVTNSNIREGAAEIIAEKEDIEVNIFPNPAVETLNIEMTNWHKVKSVELLNSRTNVIYDSGDKPVQSINIKALPTGLYVLRIKLADGSYSTRKVLVSN